MPNNCVTRTAKVPWQNQSRPGVTLQPWGGSCSWLSVGFIRTIYYNGAIAEKIAKQIKKMHSNGLLEKESQKQGEIVNILNAMRQISYHDSELNQILFEGLGD